MSNKLVDMELDEISLVRKGANQHSVITIAKSLQGEEEEMEDELFFEDGTPVNVDDLAEGDIVFDAEGGAYEITADDEGDDYDDEEDGDEEIGKAFPGTKGLVDASKRGWKAGTRNRGFQQGVRSGDYTQGAANQAKSGYTRGGGLSGAVRNASMNVSQNRGRYAVGAGGVAGGGAAGGVAAYGYDKHRSNVGKSLREEFSKALTDGDRDEVISKAFSEIEALQAQAYEAQEIAKSEQELRVFNEYVSIAKSYDLPFSDEEVAKTMMEAEMTLSEESVAIIAKSFELASSMIADELGFEGIGTDRVAEINNDLEVIGKSGNINDFVGYLEQNPDAYDAYLAEQNAR